MRHSTKVVELDGSRALRIKTAHSVANFLNACPGEQMSDREVRNKPIEGPADDEPPPKQQDGPGSLEPDVVRITREAVYKVLGHKGNVATPDVRLPSKVGTHSWGIVNVS